ncbi:MAG TPA: multiheme c-type cytochrome [Anaerolineaceae bacterium]
MSNLQEGFRTTRVLVIGLVVVLLVLGLALIVALLSRPPSGSAGQPHVDALAQSSDACVTCHRKSTPGIIEQYGTSGMAAANVNCRDCHEVPANYPGAVVHEGSNILPSPTTAKCEKCHQQEVAQYSQSRHALPAWVAFAGSKDLTPALMTQYQSIPEGQFSPNKDRNTIGAMEGPDVTKFACETCHNVGRPAADGSVGQCQKCHLRHTFSLEQVRKPETCNACHIGPDHPQWEIYIESPHGIAYHTTGQTWNWGATPGTLTIKDFPAPTCATCHFSGFGSAGTTHDTGDRLTWFLFSPISERRPAWQDNKVRMQSVCLQCHNKQFVADFYTNADKAVLKVNDWVKQSDQMMADAKSAGLLTDAPFDQPIDFDYFELWHHYGRTAKFGTWMQGPDYTQWHGAYEILSKLADLKKDIEDAQRNAGSTK